MSKNKEDSFAQGEDPAPGSSDARYSPEATAAMDKIGDDVKRMVDKIKKERAKE